MEVLLVKWLSMPFLLLINVISGLLPLFILFHRHRKHKSHYSRQSYENSSKSYRLLDRSDSQPSNTEPEKRGINVMSSFWTSFFSHANFFSAGVFLASCFLVLLPSSRDKYAALLLTDDDNSSHHMHPMSNKGMHKSAYPLPEVSVCIGFFLVWSVHVIAHMFVRSRHSQSTREHISPVPLRENCDEAHFLNQEVTDCDESLETALVSSQHCESGPNTNNNSPLHSHMHSNGPPKDVNYKIVSETAHHLHDNEATSKGTTNLLKSLFLTMALSSHSFMEGIGFGLLDTVDQAVNMLAAMLMHECLCAFALGIQLMGGDAAHTTSSSLRSSFILPVTLLIVYSLLIPTGIVVGIVLRHGTVVTSSGQTLAVLLQGCGAGTLLYVIFMEVFPGELNKSGDKGSHQHHQVIVNSRQRHSEDENAGQSHLGSRSLGHCHGSNSVFSSKTSSQTLSKLMVCIFGFASIALMQQLHSGH